ncbi:hypothetical protein HPP92_018462 [Vanilla planifolia]|uniref:Uncharacterized protein n=1 Tax=Vanilla planifolia TaxID=51239 RepID=A0A835UMX0_VANPL|nr:hypothetical protein HPP92_018462 [Vanilla planifolia]
MAMVCAVLIAVGLLTGTAFSHHHKHHPIHAPAPSSPTLCTQAPSPAPSDRPLAPGPASRPQVSYAPPPFDDKAPEPLLVGPPSDSAAGPEVVAWISAGLAISAAVAFLNLLELT